MVKHPIDLGSVYKVVSTGYYGRATMIRYSEDDAPNVFICGGSSRGDNGSWEYLDNLTEVVAGKLEKSNG